MGKEDRIVPTELIQTKALAHKVIEYLKTRNLDLPTGANVWDVFAGHVKTLAPAPQERLEANNLIEKIRGFLIRTTGMTPDLIRQFPVASVCSLMKDVQETFAQKSTTQE